LQGYSSWQDLLGEEWLFKQLKKRLLKRALGAQRSEHLGCEKGDPAGRGSGNNRNGYSGKTVIGEDGAIEIAVSRDRNGSFEPQIVAKEPAPAKAGGDPARRVRRSDHQPLCPRPVGSRDPGSPAGA
jgi:transposase-like protein